MTHLYPRGELKYRNTIQEREKGQQNSTAGERHTGRERRIMCSRNEGTINTQTHTAAKDISGIPCELDKPVINCISGQNKKNKT